MPVDVVHKLPPWPVNIKTLFDVKHCVQNSVSVQQVSTKPMSQLNLGMMSEQRAGHAC